jgi:hypothetical protein
MQKSSLETGQAALPQHTAERLGPSGKLELKNRGYASEK